MAGVDNKKLKNLFFFGISFVNFDTQDVTLDIITNIRRRFLVSKKPASNKLYRSAGGENFVYAYNFSFDRPLQWRVSKNKKVIEEIVQLASGKYCINLYDENGKDLKKTFFDSKHRWFKTNYYNPGSNDNLIYSLVPKDFDEGTSLLMYITGEVYPERLLACTIPSGEVVRKRVLSRIPTPMVTALTNAGVVYFMPEVDKDNYEHILAEEEKSYKAENAPEVFVTEEDAATGFNLSVIDFDMTKNINRTFDISLAQEFGDNENEKSASFIAEEAREISISETKEDDGSVDAAISDVVQQINALTSLDINADDILNFDLANLDSSVSDDIDTYDDYITFNDTDPAIDKQLKHIDSVLDGSSLLNSDRQLVIGENIVDDDYISSIIDGIIASAFSSDATEEHDDVEAEYIESEEITVHISVAAEDVVPESDSEEVVLVDAEANKEITELADDQNVTVADSAEEVVEETEDVTFEEPTLEETAEALAKEIISKISSADEYIKERTADLTIESRGEVYSYYGSVDENGKRSGRGRTVMSDGNIAYEGEYLDDKRKGQGSFYFKDGSLCYWGNWDNNVRSGFGVGVSSDDKAVHAGKWADNKPVGTGVRFSNDGTLMFVSSNCDDKKKGITISDLSDTSFTIRVWSEKDDAFIQREININDIIK